VLVHYATLAASSHNSQPWRFAIEERAVEVRADWTRRCPAADPDDHHLLASLGCAVENLVQAAGAFGLEANVGALHAGRIRVEFAAAGAETSPLFEAITLRQSCRAEYDGQPLPPEQLDALAAAGSLGDVRVHLFGGQQELLRLNDFIAEGNGLQMSNAGFRRELKSWIRFNAAEARAHGDGLFAGSTGNPSVPGWLGRAAFDVAYRTDAEDAKNRRHLLSSSGAAVLFTAAHGDASAFEAGRACERFALQAAALGLSVAHLNQPVEVAEVRARFAAFLGDPRMRPHFVLRFGRGPRMPRSLRRPLGDVIEG
jgi:hypothetical protein